MFSKHVRVCALVFSPIREIADRNIPGEVFHGFNFWRARINQSDMIPLSEEMSSGWDCATFSCGQRIKRANIYEFFTDFPSES